MLDRLSAADARPLLSAIRAAPPTVARTRHRLTLAAHGRVCSLLTLTHHSLALAHTPLTLTRYYTHPHSHSTHTPLPLAITQSHPDNHNHTLPHHIHSAHSARSAHSSARRHHAFAYLYVNSLHFTLHTYVFRILDPLLSLSFLHICSGPLSFGDSLCLSIQIHSQCFTLLNEFVNRTALQNEIHLIRKFKEKIISITCAFKGIRILGSFF